MQKPRVEQHRKVGIERDTAKTADIVFCRFGQAFPVDPFGNEHPVARELIDHLRRRYGVEPTRLHRRQKPPAVGGLAEVVELVDKAPTPLIHEAHDTFMREEDPDAFFMKCLPCINKRGTRRRNPTTMNTVSSMEVIERPSRFSWLVSFLQ